MAYDQVTADLIAENRKLKEALRVAADALVIASDWDIPSMQVSPPSEWMLEVAGEDQAEGWCGTYALAKKLRELAV